MMAPGIVPNTDPDAEHSATKGPSEQQAADDLGRRYKLSIPTLDILCRIPNMPERAKVLRTACQATEFQIFPIKTTEMVFFRTVNDHTSIPYRVTEPILEPWHKVFLLVQIDLAREPWPSKLTQAARKELYGERGRIYNVLDKALRCVADILGSRGDGRGVSVALDVLRSVHAGVWEGNGMELLQVEGIGPAKLQKLAEAGVHTVRKLSSMEFYHIERLLSRNPPFGQTILRQIAGFPRLRFTADVVGEYRPAAEGQETGRILGRGERVWIVRVTMGYENAAAPSWNKKTPWVTLVMECEVGGRLLWFWRGSVTKLAGGKQIVAALRTEPGDVVKATLASETVVGTLIQKTFTI